MSDIKIVMISQPMNGLEEDDIRRVRGEIASKFYAIGIEVANSLFNFKDGNYKTPALQYLAASIQVMATVDAVYFAPGWEDARGCIIERKVCELYGITILDEIPELIQDVEVVETATTENIEGGGK